MFRTLNIFHALLPHYVESHYRYAGLPSLFGKKSPQILFDMPRRLEPGQDLPVFCIIKDGDQYPFQILSFEIKTQGGKVLYREDCNFSVNTFIFLHLCSIPRKELAPYKELPLNIIPEIRIERNGKVKNIHIHNYRQLSRTPLKVYIASNKLPGSPHYLWADLHTHSFYTHNQVEFGAPPDAIAGMSKAFGINAAAITDHSFDLDDAMGEFHRPDRSLPRWKALRKDIAEKRDFIFLPGEEVSCGNEKAHNVHLLTYFNDEYIYGDDDNSAGKARQRPKLCYSDIYNRIHDNARVYAAHAAEKASRLHLLFLHRGNWHIPRTAKVHGFQIFNGKIDRHVRRAMHLWSKSLLEGRKQFIIAGNDTHGNFNRLQRVLIPNFLLTENDNLYYGRQRTGLLNATDRKSAEEALREGRMIVSNAYSMECEVENEEGRLFLLGDRATGHDFSIRIHACSDAEYGPFKHIRVYFGDLRKKKEVLLWHGNGMRYERRKTLNFTPENPGYIRAELTDRLSGWKRFAFTNPIWLN